MRLGLLFLGLAASQSVLCDRAGAADSPSDLVVVTASRIPVPAAESGSSVTVIDRDQIDARQSVFAVDLLQDVPGVAVSRSGGIGSQTQVRVRGSEANQVLVMVDGIEANDPAGNDEFGFQDLTTWDVDRIEVVRGPQSALWGSDALAGVINVITRRPTDEFVAESFAEGGAYNTVAGGGRVAGKVLGAQVGLSLSRVHSDGSNNARTGNEADGYGNTTATLTVAGSPRDDLSLDLVGRFTEASKDFDSTDFGTGLPADTADKSKVSLGYFGAGGALALLDGRWTHSLRATLTSTDTDNSNEFGANGSTGADKYGIYYQTTYHVTPGSADSTGNSVTFALDSEWQNFRQRGTVSGNFDPNQDQSIDSTAEVVELVVSPWQQTSVSLSARRDQNSDFDNVTTYRGTTAWTAAGSGTRLHASYGTGQKAPTFIERFGFYPGQFLGNPDLKPERSTGWEAGVDQPLAGGRLAVGATYFNANLTDEINGFAFDAGSGLFTAINEDGKSKRRGVELTSRAQPVENLTLSASYTYTNATQPDPTTGGDVREIRRPRNAASLNANWRFLEKRADINVNLAYTGDQTDDFFEVAPPFGTETVRLGAYTLASVSGSYRVNDQVRVYARVENLFNEDYENVYGYNTPGIGAYAGLRLTF